MIPLRIVHTESSLGWGGQEIRVLSEASGFVERGHAVTLLAPAEARIAKEAAGWAVDLVTLPIGRKRLAGFLALRRWLAANPADVVNTHSSTDSWLAALAVRTLRGSPAIVRTRHISAAVPKGAATRWLYQSAAIRIVTTGAALRRQLTEQNGFDSDRIISVPTGIDLERFSPGDRASARAATGLPGEAFIVGIVATLRSWKGHSFLVDALAALPTDIVLAIVGAGPGWEPLHEQVTGLGLGARVVFAGDTKDVVPWLRSFDLFALPSYANEGVPQAILQAQACGIPVLSTPVGAIPEVVEDGVTGRIVAPKDAAAIGAAILELRADAAACSRLAAAALERVRSAHSRAAMLDRMERVFREAVAETPR